MSTQAVAIGDSITRTGGNAIQPDIASLSWAQRVADTLGWELETHARTGASTREIRELVPAGHYHAAFLCAGTNDVLSALNWDAERFRADFDRLIDAVKAVADQVVVLGLVPNVGRLPVPFGYGWGLQRRVDTANSIIRGAARETVRVVMPPELRKPAEMHGDGVHPTSLGNVRLANAVLATFGAPAIDVTPAPTAAYLKHHRKRALRDSLKRPPRGLAASTVALLRR